MAATDRIFAGGSRTRRSVTSAFLAAVVLALGLFRGAELCLCVHEASAEDGHAHCLPCAPSCEATALSAAATAGAALVADAETCDHLVVAAADLYLAAQPNAAWSVDCAAVSRTFADTVVLMRTAAVLPPSTAPPESGDSFLSYRDRVFLRS
ncbi:MAG: hypothetical protein ACI4RD_06205 [Kiritimatiellia bacterium]